MGDPQGFWRAIAHPSLPLSSPLLALFLSPVSCRLPLLPAPRLLLPHPSCLKGTSHFFLKLSLSFLSFLGTICIIVDHSCEVQVTCHNGNFATVKNYLLVDASSTRVPRGNHNLNVLELLTGFTIHCSPTRRPDVFHRQYLSEKY